MKIIGLMPVRNESWVLRHSLACLAGFCDVVIVSDQRSEDDSREICRQFPQVRVLESSERRVCEQARWQLLDAARNYDGHNLLWWSDADELLSPRLMNAWLDSARDRLAPGTPIECLFYHLWGSTARYRSDAFPYGPHWKSIGFVDDRQMDYDRSLALPLHEPRVPSDRTAPLRAEPVPVFHLQWLLPNRNQMKQAWYRCRELMDGHKSAADINHLYMNTLPAPRAPTSPVPRAWVEDITFPDPSADREPSWHERDLFTWFDAHGIERFEPLEIWHIAPLRREFVRRIGRRPKSDRSYVAPWPRRARRFGRRMLGAAWRRIAS